MIIGHGIDIIDIDRIRKTLDRHGDRFLRKIFTEGERDYCQQKVDPAPACAARFAAKEAFAKAIGTGIGQHINWLDVEVVKDEHNAPSIRLSQRLKSRYENVRIFLSLSHTKSHATASVILEKENG